MRHWFERAVSVLVVCGQVWIGLYLPWMMWRAQILDTGHALMHMTTSSAIQAMAAGGLIALCVFLLEKRCAWLERNAYWAVAPLFGRHAGQLRSIDTTFGARPEMMMYFVRFNSVRDHWLLAKLEKWVY